MKNNSSNSEVQFCGTGFFLNKNNNLVLVTNRHVIEPWFSNKEYIGYNIVKFEIETNFIIDNGNSCISSRVEITNYSNFKFSKNVNDDVACLFEPRGSNLRIDFSIPYDFVADDEWINTKLSVCDNIAYPNFSPYYNKIYNSPIFRMGIIASDPRFDYSGKNDGINSKRIAFEGFSFSGASGSPIFATQKGYKLGDGLIDESNSFYRETKLIGINAGHYHDQSIAVLNQNPEISLSAYQHSGISYFYKSSIIKNIIDSNIIK